MASAASTNGKPSNGGSNGNGAAAQASTGYKEPPKEILDIVDAPAQPALTFSPDRKLVSESPVLCGLTAVATAFEQSHNSSRSSNGVGLPCCMHAMLPLLHPVLMS
jgi:hypothetical protein